MTPDFQNGQTTKIYPLASPISLPTTASSTNTIPCHTYCIDTRATLSYYALIKKPILVKD